PPALPASPRRRAPTPCPSPTRRTTPRCGSTPTTRDSAPATGAPPDPGNGGPRGPPAPRPRPDHRDHRDHGSPVPRPPRLVDPYRSGHVATGTEPPATEPHPRRGGVRTGTRAAIAAPHLWTDSWWLAPAATAAGLMAFVVHSTLRAFANTDYYTSTYVSTFYSPCPAENCVPSRAGPNWE